MPDWCVFCQSNPSTCPVHGRPRDSRTPPPHGSRFPKLSPGPGRKACASCSGTGLVSRYRDGVRIRCPICLGDGYVKDVPRCHLCKIELVSWAEVYEHLLNKHPGKESGKPVSATRFKPVGPSEDSPEHNVDTVGPKRPEEQRRPSEGKPSRPKENVPTTRKVMIPSHTFKHRSDSKYALCEVDPISWTGWGQY